MRFRPSMLLLIFALGLGLSGVHVTPASAHPIAGTLIVLNKSDHNAALVDAGTLEVRAKLPTGRGPHEAAVSPDGRFAYVTNYGAYAVFREQSERRMEPGNTITVLDPETSKVKTTFDLGEFSVAESTHERFVCERSNG